MPLCLSSREPWTKLRDPAAAYLCDRMCRRRDGLGDVLNGFVPFLFLFHGGDFYCRKMLERSIISITIKAHTNVHCPCVYICLCVHLCVCLCLCVCACVLCSTHEKSHKKDRPAFQSCRPRT